MFSVSEVILEDQEMAFSPLKPLQKTEKEQKQVQSLEELAVLAVPNPEEIARQFFPRWHTVRLALEEGILRNTGAVSKGTRQEIWVCNEGIKVCG